MQDVQSIIEKIKKEMKREKIELTQLGVDSTNANKHIKTKYINMMIESKGKINYHRCTTFIENLIKEI